VLSTLPTWAQFSSGSTGADGALSFTTPSSTPIYFDPATLMGHKAGDTVFNFTTITIAAGVTVRLDSRKLAGPVYWLATGAVQIAGTLDLSGLNGYPATNLQSQRLPSTPGAGGYAGGVGAGASLSASPGFGPGGGLGWVSGQHAASGGQFTGSQYLIPLVGGSGGGGGSAGCNGPTFGGGGGAGGGAILIASSASIVVTGLINLNGGNGGDCAGGGAGGAVRLVANTLSGTGEITARQGQGGGPSNGFLRFECFTCTATFNVNGTPFITTGNPSAVSVPANGPSTILATSVNGTPITANPFSFPDATINSASAIPIVISGQYVPLNATISLYIFSEDGADQVISVPALTGSLASSTTTVNVTYPPQGSWGLIRATWQ
jgi:hypothetical protein